MVWTTVVYASIRCRNVMTRTSADGAWMIRQLMRRLPFYSIVKFGFFLWLALPQTQVRSPGHR